MRIATLALAMACAPSACSRGSAGDLPPPRVAPSEPRLALGPMIGHTTDESVRIWVRAEDAETVTAIVQSADGEEERGMVRADSGFAVVEVDGLEPATEHTVRLLLGGVPVETPRSIAFATFPIAGAPVRLRMAFVSCARVSWDSVQTIWTAIAADEPDVVVWLGDNNYFEEGDSIRPDDWEDPARMAFKYAELRGLATLQPLLGQAVHYAIWDDHDYADGDSDRTFPLKADVDRVFERFWANPYYGGPGIDGIYSHVVMGDVELFLTDDRFHRDPEDAPRRPGKTMLGAEQLRWLKERLAASTARLKIVAVGVQVLADYHLYDGYLNYPHERDEILDWIRDERIEGVVFVSGDRHLSELMRYEPQGGYPLYELTASPAANRQFTDGLQQPNPIRLGGYSQGFNYGLLDIDTSSSPPTLTFRLRDAEGREVFSHQVRVEDLEFVAGLR